LVELTATGREHDDRHLGLRAYLSTDLQSVEVGQIRVQQNDIGLMMLP
jgi:hypothetical protein